MVTTTLDLAVVTFDNGCLIQYQTTSEDALEITLSPENLDYDVDSGPFVESLRDFPLPVRNCATAYLCIHKEDVAFRIHIRPVLKESFFENQIGFDFS